MSANVEFPHTWRCTRSTSFLTESHGDNACLVCSGGIGSLFTSTIIFAVLSRVVIGSIRYDDTTFEDVFWGTNLSRDTCECLLKSTRYMYSDLLHGNCSAWRSKWIILHLRVILSTVDPLWWSLHNNVFNRNKIWGVSDKVENHRTNYLTPWTGMVTTTNLPEVT